MLRSISLAVLALATATASPYVFTPIVPCAGCSAGVFNINNSGQVSGVAFDSAGGHAFFGQPGAYTLFDAPGAVFTEATSINDSGVIGGDAFTSSGQLRAFRRDPDGTIEYLPMISGAEAMNGGNINNTGLVTGNYTVDPFGSTPVYGFILDGANLTAPIEFPGAFSTQLGNANDSGVVAGYYLLTGVTGIPQSFLRTAEGTLLPFAIPGAVGTQLYDINNLGHLTGGYIDAAGVMHGFIYRDGIVTSIDYSGPNTVVFGLNDMDQIVGASYPDGGFFTGPYDGFVASTPEPSTLVLTFLGLPVLCSFRRRRSH